MSFLKTMSVIIYSLAFAQAGTDSLTTKEGISLEFLIIIGALTIPIFSYLVMKVITNYKLLVDSSNSVSQNYDEDKSSIFYLPSIQQSSEPKKEKKEVAKKADQDKAA